MLTSRRSQIPEFSATFRSSQECSYIVQKSIYQEVYQCLQCFDYPHGICKYCYDHCHKLNKNTYHKATKLIKIKGYFQCECGLQHHQKYHSSVIEKCIIYSIINNKQQCENCQAIICDFCKQNCIHIHNNENNDYQGCQCIQPHFSHQYMNYILNLVKQLQYSSQTQTYLQQLKCTQLINNIINNYDLQDIIFGYLKNTFDDIFNELETGDYNQSYIWSSKIIQENQEGEKNLHEKLLLYFNERRFPYGKILQILTFILKLIGKSKLNCKFISQKIYDLIDCNQIKLLICQYQLLAQNMYDQNREKFTQLIQMLLKLQHSIYRHRFSKFRKLNTQEIENTTFISRNFIKQYNQNIDHQILQVEIIEIIKCYYKILFNMEITNQIVHDLLIILLKYMKMCLQSGLLQNMKVIIKVLLNLEKFCRDIDYYNQQKNDGYNKQIFTTQFFNLLAKILLLSYFFIRDDNFILTIKNQCEKQKKSENTFIQQYMNLFYHDEKKGDHQLQLLYNGDYDQLYLIQRIFINIVINYTSNQQNQNKLELFNQKYNEIIQLMLRENLFIDTILKQQITQVQIEDLLLWYQGSFLQIENQNFLQISQELILQIQLLINTICQQQSEDMNQLNFDKFYQSLQDFQQNYFIQQLYTFENSLITIYSNNMKSYSTKNLSDDINNHLKCNFKFIKETQLQLFILGIDEKILNFLKIISQINYKELSILQSQKIIELIEKLLNLLQLILLYNQQLINIVLIKENFNLFEQLVKIEFNYYGQSALFHLIMNFYYRLFIDSGFLIVYQTFSINLEFFCNHLIILNDILNNIYKDESEISYQFASKITYLKYQLIQLMTSQLEYLINCNDQIHDYQQHQVVCENLYNKVLVQVINHLIELFQKETDFTPESSYDDVFNQKNKRFSKISLFTALELIQVNPINQGGFSPTSNKSSSSFHSANSFQASIILQQTFTIKQLKEIYIKQQYTTSKIQLAVVTIVIANTALNFMTLLIDYFNRNQLLENQELSEQATIIEKIEQVYQYINETYKSYQLFKGSLGAVEEFVSSIHKFVNLINYSIGQKHDNKPPEIFQIRENNISCLLSQKAIDNIVIKQNKNSFKILNKFLLKLKFEREEETTILQNNSLIYLIQKEYENKSREKCSNIYLNLLIQLLSQQSQFKKTLEHPYTIFMTQINQIIQLQRLLQIETKAVQQIIESNMNDIDQRFQTFKFNLDIFLDQMSKILPQLFQHVILYQNQPYMSIVTNSGKYSIIVLEFIRYLGEGQNGYLQQYIGKSGLLESLLKLLVELLKSKQILEIVRETNTMKIKTIVQSNFQKVVRNVTTQQLKKRGSSTTDYLLQFLKQRKRSRRQTMTQNEFMQFEIHSLQGDQYAMSVSQTFLKLFAHTIITIAEFNQGQQLINQQLTLEYLSKNRVWQIVIQILTVRTNEKQQNSVYTLRVYIFQLMLSLLEDPERSSDDFQFIMNMINHKLLEETLTQTYRALIIFNKLELKDLGIIDIQLTELYRRELGDNINESLLFDSKMLIKILYQIYLMLNLYALNSIEVNQYLQDQKHQFLNQSISIKRESDLLARSAFMFLFKIVGRIEYVNQREQLQTIHFLKPPMCFFLSAETKFQFLNETIDRSNPASKLASIFDQIPQFMTEMKENMSKYRKSQLFQRFINIAISPNFHHRQLAVILTILNFIILVMIGNNNYIIIQKQQNGNQLIEYYEETSILQFLLQSLLIIMSFLSLICQLFFRMSIYLQISCNQLEHTFYNTFIIIYQILTRRDIFQFFLHFVFSILGTFEPFFFYIQSFCFIYMSKTMSSVLEALRLRWIQFLGIFTVLLIILNAYSYIGFRRFASSFQMEVIAHPENDDIHEEELLCDTPAHCFISLVYFGLREGSGLSAYGDIESYHKSSDYFPRFIFDFSFFIIVTLIMINIINGIIIDTFAELRDKQQQNEYDRNNVCVICSLERWEFEKQGHSFNHHINEVHNLSNFIAFIVYLHNIGKQNMNGIETYIYSKILNRDMSWTPQKLTFTLQEKI